MNSKSILRRTLPLIVALAVIIIVAVSCTLLSGDKKNPNISNPDGVFLQAGDVKVNNEQIYSDLKPQLGTETLFELVDEYLLTKLKNSDGASYFSSVTLEEIDEAIENAIFPNGRTKVAEDDDKTIEKWYDSIFISRGFHSQEQIRNYYRLVLARKAYANDTIRKEYQESVADADVDDTITESEITSYYSSNYKNDYWTVVVPFNSLVTATNALNQIDIEIKTIKVDDKDVRTWVKAGTEIQLTEEEVKQAFIDLYNNAYSDKAIGYPNANPVDNQVVRLNVHYNVVDGKIQFLTNYDEDLEVDNIQEDSNLFFYTNQELSKVNSGLVTYVGNTLKAISNPESTLLQTFTVNPRTFDGSASYYFVLKIAQEEAPLESEVKAEIIEKLIESKTTAEQTKKLAELRATYRDNGGFIIYDSQIEAAYVQGFDATHPITKKTSENVVLLFDGVEYTADDLFEILSERHGALVSIDFYNYEYLLYSDYNKIYDYKGKNTEGTVIDQDEWDDILEQIVLEKRNFSSGAYEDYGFPASYGWEKFMNEFYIQNYGQYVGDEQDLKMLFLYQAVVKEFSKDLANTEKLWDEVYVPNMNKIYDEFLNAKGVHLLIYKQDENGKNIDPKDWTPYEQQIAKEFYNLVIAELKLANPNKLADILKTTIPTEYTNAPRFVANTTQEIANQPVYTSDKTWIDLDPTDYKYSKFKTAGFLIKFEELTTTAGVMVEPFEKAVKEIWDEAIANNEVGDYIKIYEGYSEDYIITEFGYHVYVNQTVSNRTTSTVDGEKVPVERPTLDKVLLYEEDTNHGDLDAFTKLGISTYYSTIRTELTGANYYQLNLYLDLQEKADQLQYSNTKVNDQGQLDKVLKFYIDTYYSRLTYIENPNGE